MLTDLGPSHRDVISCPACKRRLIGPIAGVQTVRCPGCGHTWELPAKHEQTPARKPDTHHDRANDTRADQPLNHARETLDEPLFRPPEAVKRQGELFDCGGAEIKTKQCVTYYVFLGRTIVYKVEAPDASQAVSIALSKKPWLQCYEKALAVSTEAVSRRVQAPSVRESWDDVG